MFKAKMQKWASVGLTTDSGRMMGLWFQPVFREMERRGELPIRLAYSALGSQVNPRAGDFYMRLGDISVPAVARGRAVQRDPSFGSNTRVEIGASTATRGETTAGVVSGQLVTFEYRVVGAQGALVLALPRRQHVYALKLVYEIPGDGLRRPPNFLSWDRDGRVPPAPGYGHMDQLVPSDGPTPTLVLVDRETDLLRIDLVGAGTPLRVHALSILSRAP